MAKVTVVLDIPGVSVDQLKQDVVDVDARHSSPEEAVSKEHVTAYDLVGMIYCGDIGYESQLVLVEQFEED